MDNSLPPTGTGSMGPPVVQPPAGSLAGNASPLLASPPQSPPGVMPTPPTPATTMTAAGQGGVPNAPGIPAMPIGQQGLINPLIKQAPPPPVQGVAAAPGVGPAGAGLPAAAVDMGDDDTAQDDAVWVGRAKRIIGQTQGDPHRQLQLLQQLGVVFLKERYGRSVHSDDV